MPRSGGAGPGTLAPGNDGVTPHIDTASGNWFIGTFDTGIHAQGAKGDPGSAGASGSASKARRTPFGGSVPIIGWGCTPHVQTAYSGAGTGSTGRAFYKAACAATDLRLLLPAWIFPFTGEAAAANQLFHKAAIEIGGVAYPVTFSGVRRLTLDPWGMVASDPVSIDVAKGDTFAVRLLWDTPASGSYLGMLSAVGPPSYGGLATGYGYSSSDSVDSAAAVATKSNVVPGTMTVLGTPLGTPPNVMIGVGDSITFGVGEDPPYDQGNGGYLTRAVNDQIPFFMTAVPTLAGSTIAGPAGHSRLGVLWSMGTHASVLLGTNDIAGSDTTATIQANLVRVWTALAGRGLKVNALTIPPRNNTPGTKRVPINDWIRGGAPLDPISKAPVAVGTSGALVAGNSTHPLWGYFDTADALETARNSGLWKPGLDSGDTTHPSTAGHQAMAAAIDLTTLPAAA